MVTALTCWATGGAQWSCACVESVWGCHCGVCLDAPNRFLSVVGVVRQRVVVCVKLFVIALGDALQQVTKSGGLSI